MIIIQVDPITTWKRNLKYNHMAISNIITPLGVPEGALTHGLLQTDDPANERFTTNYDLRPAGV